MTIQVELNPESVARLTADAQARGVALETYASDLLQEVLSSGSRNARLTKERFHAMLRALAAGSDQLPDLPTESFTRESYYEDRT
jgi:hypothetical protein